MKVNTLDEGAIRDIGHAFGYYDYGAERGLIDLFPGRDAVASYICGYMRMALLAARALSEKKGREIQVLEIADLTTLADYFVLCTGSSNTQINALVDNVEKVLTEQAGEEPLHREGYRGGTWVLLDYGCIAVHVFSGEAREFYGLERLWRDGKSVDLAGIVTDGD